MTRNTAREIATHLAYELSFTDLPIQEFLNHQTIRVGKKQFNRFPVIYFRNCDAGASSCRLDEYRILGLPCCNIRKEHLFVHIRFGTTVSMLCQPPKHLEFIQGHLT